MLIRDTKTKYQQPPFQDRNIMKRMKCNLYAQIYV